MKWATNKRLHFELGVIKSIQTLGEVRIADVIKVLTRGADVLGESAAHSPAPQAPEKPAAAEPTAPSPPRPLPRNPSRPPHAEPPAKPKPAASGLAAFDSMIAAAPEVSEAPPPPDPPPWTEETKPEARTTRPGTRRRHLLSGPPDPGRPRKIQRQSRNSLTSNS